MALILMGDWCGEEVTDTTTLKNRVWKETENHSGKEKES
jgi:hypothetical protein